MFFYGLTCNPVPAVCIWVSLIHRDRPTALMSSWAGVGWSKGWNLEM